jgi:hypothetical protein
MKRTKKKAAFTSENGQVETKAALARAIGVSRPTLYTWFNLPDAPLVTDGGHDVAAWEAFRDARLTKEPSESRELRLENLRLQVSLKQVQLMKLAGDLIPLEWAKGLVADHAIKVRNIIQGSDLSEAQKHDLTENILALNQDDYIDGLRAQIGEERETE